MSNEHVIMTGNPARMRCTHCGTEKSMTLKDGDGRGVDLLTMVTHTKTFAEAHEACPAPKGPRCDLCGSADHIWEGHVNAVCKTPLDWPECGDTGISSTVIFRHMMGLPQDREWGPGHPSDPSDFGRCFRLLAAEWAVQLGWRARIGEMAKYGQVWARLAAEWDKLTALYEEERTKREAPKLYKLMRQLIDGKRPRKARVRVMGEDGTIKPVERRVTK